MDWRVFAFLLLVCLTVGIALGVTPAISAARHTGAALKSVGVRSRLRDTLIVVEVALAFVLLTGAGLLLRTFVNLRHTDTGVDPQHVLTAHVVLSNGAQAMAIEQRLMRIRDVRAAGLITQLPLQDSDWGAGFNIAGVPGARDAELAFVTPGYFAAMGIPLRRGRVFSESDRKNAPGVILVNEALARQYLPGEDPLGRKTDRGTIIGVVGDVHQSSLAAEAKPQIFYCVAQNFAQIGQVGSIVVVRGRGNDEALLGAIRAAIREVRPGQAVFRIATMEEVIDQSLSSPRLYSRLVGLFALLALVQVIAGIYGVIAYLVALRTREFSIRMALGANAWHVMRLVMRRGASLASVGLAFGVAGAAALTSVLRNVLYGISATDAATYAVTAAALMAAALAACLVPAQKAARVDLSATLRAE